MRVRATLAAVFALLGFLVVASVSATDEARRTAQPRREQLIRLIQEQRRAVEALGEESAALRGRVTDLEARSSTEAAARLQELQRIELLAGLVPVEGPGVRVVMRDSDVVTRDPAKQRALRVIDLDLQLVTNALWAARADAVSVNGQRLISTTSIRGAGETITVNFHPLAPPYEIIAVGVDVERFMASEVAERFTNWTDLFGFGFEVTTHDRVEIRAFAGSARLSAARPGDA